MAKFDKFFFIKLPKKIHIYNSINSIDINRYKTDHIFQEVLQSQILFRLTFSKLNLKVEILIILLCNVYPTIGEV